MTPTLLAMAMQMLTAPGLDRWEVIAGNGQQGLAVDPQSIRRTGDRATIVVRTPTGQTSGPVIVVMRYSYDCVRNTVTREAGNFYRADGTFVGAVGVGDRNLTIPPTSIHARFRDRACGTQ